MSFQNPESAPHQVTGVSPDDPDFTPFDHDSPSRGVRQGPQIRRRRGSDPRGSWCRHHTRVGSGLPGRVSHGCLTNVLTFLVARPSVLRTPNKGSLEPVPSLGETRSQKRRPLTDITRTKGMGNVYPFDSESLVSGSGFQDSSWSSTGVQVEVGTGPPASCDSTGGYKSGRPLVGPGKGRPWTVGGRDFGRGGRGRGPKGPFTQW